MLAGGKYKVENSTHYLNVGRQYWLLSPYNFSSNFANVWDVGTGYTGAPSGSRVTNNGHGVRPSISLKPGGIWSGNGTADSPYQVSYS